MMFGLIDARGVRRFKRSVLSRIGLGLVMLFILVALVGPLFIPEGAMLPKPEQDVAPPLTHGLLGRADNGVDLLSAMILGTRLSLFVAFLSTVISATTGVLLGAFSGTMGGRTDAIIMRVVDVLLAFPGILLAIYIAAVLPPSVLNVVFALSATGWVGYARLARGQVLEVRGREFVEAAIALGAGKGRIILRHILPNIIGPVCVQASLGLSTAILAEAALSFLGLGVPPGTPSWGALLDEGVYYILSAPHLSILPGLAIAVSVLAFNFLGDGLRDVFDVRASR